MWEILGHSFPPLLLQLASNKGHFLMVNTEREEGSLSSGKDSSFRQYVISRFSRDDRCCSHFPSKHFTSKRLYMYIDTREFESNGISISISAFKRSSPSMCNVVRQVSLCKLHSLIALVQELPRLQTIKVCKLIGKPSFEKDTRFGRFWIVNPLLSLSRIDTSK